MDFDSDQSLKEWVKDKPLSILQLDPADRAVLRIADERDAIQKKTFTKWVNKHLKKAYTCLHVCSNPGCCAANLHVGDLFVDLQDGLNLISLLEVLSGEPLPREKGRLRFHMLQNVQMALDFLRYKKIKLVNIRAEDIVDGNPKLTLGLIWTIILHFQISDIVVGEESHVSARDALLKWARRSTAKYPGVRVNDFTSSWKDGLAFNAIIHRNRPDLVDWRSIRSRVVRERLEHAFHVAEREYGVTRLLDPEDVDTHEIDEKSIITYISSLYDVFPEPPQVHPLYDSKYSESIDEVDIEVTREQTIHEEKKRLDRLQRLADKVHREIKRIDIHMEDTETKIKEESRRLERLHPLDAKHNIELIEQELRVTEENIQSLFTDIQTLREGRYPQASDLNKRVEKLHQRWLSLRSLLHSRLIAPLSSLSFPYVEEHTVTRQSRTILETRLIDTNPYFKNLQECIEWCSRKLKQIQEAEYGSDLPGVQAELNSHLREHNSIEQFHSRCEQCIDAKNNFHGDELTVYTQHLNTLQKLYTELLSVSGKRLSDLETLLDFLQSASNYLVWLNEKEEIELTRDWSDRDLNLANVQQYYQSLMTELEKREIQFSAVQDRGESLLLQHHPASKTIESYMSAMNNQWSWILQLTLCLETHLKHSSYYQQFYKDVKEAETWLNKRDELLNTTYSQSDFTLDEGERLLKGMQELREELNQYSEVVQNLAERAQNVVPLKQRRQPVTRPIPILAICNYKQNNVNIQKGDQWVLHDNSGRIKWRVSSGASGSDCNIPGVVFLIPPPDKEALEAVERLKRQFERSIALWQRKQLRMRQNMIFSTIKVVRSWDLAQFLAMGADQRNAIRKALNEDAAKLLEEGDPADPQLRRLRREMDEVNRLFDEFERRAREDEENRNATRVFNDKIALLQASLDEAEHTLNTKLNSPIPRDVDSLEHLVIQHKDFETRLKALNSDMDAVQEAFKGITRKTPAIQSKMDRVLNQWNNLWNLSHLYVERLKCVEIVLSGMNEMNHVLSDFEIKLASYGEMPSELEALKVVHKDLLTLQNNVTMQQSVIDQLMEDGRNTRRLVEKSRHHIHHGGPHHDLDRLDTELNRLTTRWNNICSQLVDRLRSCEAAYALLEKFANSYQQEVKIIEESYQKLNALTPIKSQAIEQIEPTKNLFKKVTERIPAVEQVNIDGGRFIREAKIYDVRLLHYCEWLVDEVHPQLETSVNNKKKIKLEHISGCGEAAVSHDLDVLNNRFETLMNVLYDRIKQMAALYPDDAELKELVDKMEPKPLRTFRTEFSIYEQQSSSTTYISSPDRIINGNSADASDRTAEKSNLYLDLGSRPSNMGNSSSSAPLNGNGTSTPATAYESMHFTEIRSLRRVNKVEEGIGRSENGFDMTEMKGIVHPETKEILTVEEAIRLRILDVRSGKIAVNPGSKSTYISIPEAVQCGLVMPELADRLLGPCGIVRGDGKAPMSLLEAIQRELVDAERGPMERLKVNTASVSIADDGHELGGARKMANLSLSLYDLICLELVDRRSGLILDRDTGNRLNMKAAVQKGILNGGTREIVDAANDNKITLNEAIECGIVRDQKYHHRLSGETIALHEAKRRRLIIKPLSLKDCVDMEVMEENGLFKSPIYRTDVSLMEAVELGVLDADVHKTVVNKRTGQLVTLGDALNDGLITPTGFYVDKITKEMIPIHNAVERGFLYSVAVKSVFDIAAFKLDGGDEFVDLNRALDVGLVKNHNNAVRYRYNGEFVSIDEADDKGCVRAEVRKMFDKKVGIQGDSEELTVIEAAVFGYVNPKTGMIIDRGKNTDVPFNKAVKKKFITAEGVAQLKSLLAITLSTQTITKTIVRYATTVQLPSNNAPVQTLEVGVSHRKAEELKFCQDGKIDEQMSAKADKTEPRTSTKSPIKEKIIKILEPLQMKAPEKTITEVEKIADHSDHFEVPPEGWDLETAIKEKYLDPVSGLLIVPGTDRLVSLEECVNLEIINPKSAVVVEANKNRRISLERSFEKQILNCTGHYQLNENERITMKEAIERSLIQFVTSSTIPVSEDNARLVQFAELAEPAKDALEPVQIRPNTIFDPETALVIFVDGNSSDNIVNAIKSGKINASEIKMKVSGARMDLEEAMGKGVVDLESETYAAEDGTKMNLKEAIKTGVVAILGCSLMATKKLSDGLSGTRTVPDESGRWQSRLESTSIPSDDECGPSLAELTRSRVTTEPKYLVSIGKAKSVSPAIEGARPVILQKMRKKKVKPKDAITSGIIDEKTADLFESLQKMKDSQGRRLKLFEALDLSNANPNAKLIKDPQRGDMISIKEAVERGILDDSSCEVKLLIPVAKSLSLPDLVKQGLVENGKIIHPETGVNITLPEAIACDIVDRLSKIRDPNSGNVLSLEDAMKEGIVRDNLHIKTRQGDVDLIDVSRNDIFVEDDNQTKLPPAGMILPVALQKGLYDSNTNEIKHPLTGEKKPLEVAIREGLIMSVPFYENLEQAEVVVIGNDIADNFAMPKEQYQTVDAFLQSYDEKEAKFKDYEKGNLLTLEEAVHEKLLDADMLVYDKRNKMAVTLKDAIQAGIVDGKKGTVKDDCGRDLSVKEAVKMGLLTILGAPLLAGKMVADACTKGKRDAKAVTPMWDNYITITKHLTPKDLALRGVYDTKNQMFLHPESGDEIGFRELILNEKLFRVNNIFVKDLEEIDSYLPIQSALTFELVDNDEGFMTDPNTERRITFFESVKLGWITELDSPKMNRMIIGVTFEEAIEAGIVDKKTCRVKVEPGQMLDLHVCLTTGFILADSVCVRNPFTNEILSLTDAVDCGMVDLNVGVLRVNDAEFDIASAFRKGLVFPCRKPICLVAVVRNGKYNRNRNKIIDDTTGEGISLEESVNRQIVDPTLAECKDIKSNEYVVLDRAMEMGLLSNCCLNNTITGKPIKLDTAIGERLIINRPFKMNLMDAVLCKYYDAKSRKVLNPCVGCVQTVQQAVDAQFIDIGEIKIKDVIHDKYLPIHQAISNGLIDLEKGLVLVPVEMTFNTAIEKKYMVVEIPSSSGEPKADDKKRKIMKIVVDPSSVILKYDNKTLSFEHAIDEGIVDAQKSLIKIGQRKISFHEAIDAGILIEVRRPMTLKEAINKGVFDETSGLFLDPNIGKYLTLKEAIDKNLLDPNSVLVKDTRTEPAKKLPLTEALHGGVVNGETATVKHPSSGVEMSLIQAYNEGLILDNKIMMPLQKALDLGFYDESDGKMINPNSGEKFTLREAVKQRVINYATPCHWDRKNEKMLSLKESCDGGLIDDLSGRFRTPRTRKTLNLVEASNLGFIVKIENIGLYEAAVMGFFHDGLYVNPENDRRLTLREAVKQNLIDADASLVKSLEYENFLKLAQAVELRIIDDVCGVYAMPKNNEQISFREACTRGLIVPNFDRLLHDVAEYEYFDEKNGTIVDPVTSKRISVREAVEKEFISGDAILIRDPKNDEYKLLNIPAIEGQIVPVEEASCAGSEPPQDSGTMKELIKLKDNLECTLEYAIVKRLIEPTEAVMKCTTTPRQYTFVEQLIKNKEIDPRMTVKFTSNGCDVTPRKAITPRGDIFLKKPYSLAEAVERKYLNTKTGTFRDPDGVVVSLKNALAVGFIDADTALVKDYTNIRLLKIDESIKKGLFDPDKNTLIDTNSSRLYSLSEALLNGIVVTDSLPLLEALHFGLYNPVTGLFNDPFYSSDHKNQIFAGKTKRKLTLDDCVKAKIIDPQSVFVKDTSEGKILTYHEAVDKYILDTSGGKFLETVSNRTMDLLKAKNHGYILPATARQAMEEKYRLCDDTLTELLSWVGEIEDRISNQDVAQEDVNQLRNQINILKLLKEEIDSQARPVTSCLDQVRQVVATGSEYLSREEISNLERKGKSLRTRYDRANERTDKLLRRLLAARDELTKFKNDLTIFTTWMEKAQKTVEEKEKSISNLNKIDGSSESTRDFVSDVIAHQADLRFITMAAQKFVDESKEYLTCLNEFRTSLPQRLPHIEPISTHDSVVKNTVATVSTQYRDLLARVNALSDKLSGLGSKQKEYRDALGAAKAWLREAEPRANKILIEPVAADPHALEDQLSRTKALNNEFVAQGRLIDDAKQALDALLRSLEGQLSPTEAANLRNPVTELENKYRQLCDALAEKCQTLDNALVQSQGVQDALDSLLHWLNDAENTLKNITRPASLHKERLEDQMREHRVLRADIDSHKVSVDSVAQSAQELINTASNPRLAKKIETKLRDVISRYDKLYDKTIKRNELLAEIHHNLTVFNDQASSLERWLGEALEVVPEASENKVEDLISQKETLKLTLDQVVRDGKALINHKDVTDTANVRDRIKALESLWKDLNQVLDDKHRNSKLRSEQLNAYEKLRDQVLVWLTNIENRVNRLDPVAVEMEMVKKQIEELKPILKEHREYSVTIDKVNDLGNAFDSFSRPETPTRRRNTASPTKRTTLSATYGRRGSQDSTPSPSRGIGYLTQSPGGSSGFGSRRSSQDGFYLDELSDVQQQLAEINNRYNLLGARLSDRQSELDNIKEELRKHLEHFRSLSQFLDKIQRMLPKETVPQTKEDADKMAKNIKSILEEMYEKQALLESTRSGINELLRKKPTAFGADILHDEIQEISSRWKNLNDLCKNRIEILENLKDFHDTHDNLSNWLSAKDRMMTVLGPISSDSRMVQSQVQQVQVLREEFRTQQPQLNHFKNLGENILSQIPDRKSPDAQKISTKLANIQKRWNDLLSRLDERAENLGAAADSSREFDAGLTRLRDALQGISDQLDDIPLDKEPEEQLRKVQALERQLEGQRPLLADLEAAGAQLCEVLSDPTSRAEIQGKLSAVNRQYNNLQKKLDHRKAEIEGSLRDGRQFEATCARSLGWLGEQLGQLPERLLVSADKDVLQQQVEQHEPIYKEVIHKEHEIIMLLNKGRDLLARSSQLNRTDSRNLERELDKIQQLWDRLRRDAVDRQTRLQTCMEHCRKYYKALETFIPWLSQAENKLDSLRPDTFKRTDVERQLRELSLFRNDVWKHSGEFENLKTLGETFLAACDVDKELVKQELAAVKNRWDKLNNELLERTQWLEDTARRLADFSENLRDLGHSVQRCEDKLASHDALGGAARDPKMLDRIKALREETVGLRKPLQGVRQTAKDLVAEAAELSVGDASHLLDDVDGISERLDDLQAKLDDRCSQLQSASTALAQYNEKVKGLSVNLSSLEQELDAMKPVGRDVKTVRSQLDDIIKLVKKIVVANDDVRAVVDAGEHLVDSGFAPDTAVTREQTEALSRQLNRLDERARNRQNEIETMLEKLLDFQQNHNAVLDDITHAGEELRRLKPVGSEVEVIKSQQDEFANFRKVMIEPLAQSVDDVNRSGQGLIQSAAGGVNTSALEKDLEKMNDKWNALKDKLNERDRKLDVGLLQSGKFQEALAGLAKWLTDTEEMVANQKPPSADYKVVKAQLQEQKFLKKMLLDRQNSMSSLFAMGSEVAASADPSERKAIERQLRDLMQRFDNLTEGAAQRMDALERAMLVAKEFQDKLVPILEWLDTTEKKIKDMELVPTDEEKIQQRIKEHDALHKDILRKKPALTELTEVASALMALVGEDEATGVADKLQDTADRYTALVDASENVGQLLQASRAGLRHLVLTYQDLQAWMESMDNRLNRYKVMPVHSEKLLRHMEDLADVTEEISNRQMDVDSTVDSGLELMKHISNDEAIQLKDKLDSLQRRYHDLVSRGADLLKNAQEALPLVQQFHNSHNRLVDWMMDAESQLQVAEPREEEIARLEMDIQEFRPVLENINLIGPQLCQISPGEGAATIEGLVTRDNRRFDAIAEQIQRKAERIHLSKQRSLEVIGDIDELLDWFREVENQLRDSEPPSAEPDIIRMQLKEHRALNDDISSQKSRVRDVLSTAKKVLRESVHSEEITTIREKMEDLKDIMDAVSKLSSDRLGILEQALPLAEHFHQSHADLSSWLDDMEHQVSMLAMPALRPDLIAQQQDRNEMFVQSINEHKPLIEKLNKTGEALIRLCNPEEGSKVQEILDSDNARYAALRLELRQRQQALEKALQETSQFSDKLEGMLRALANTAEQIAGADPISAHPPRIRDQIDENGALVEDLDKREEAFLAVKKAANDVINKAPNASDPAVRDMKRKLEKLNNLWNEVQKATTDRGRSLDEALALAEKFWEELQAVMATLRDLQDSLNSQEPPAVQPAIIQQQQVALREIKAEIDQTKPEVEQCRASGHQLMRICGEPDKPEVKKHIEDLDNAWDNITALFAKREENLINAIEKAMEFHETLQDILDFLDKAEIRFSKLGPLGSDIDAVKRQIAQLKQFKADVDPHMVKVEALNRQAQELTERTSAEQAAALKEPLASVNRRWDELLRGIVERQRQLENALLRLGQFQHALAELLAWIDVTNRTLDHELKPVAGDPQLLEIELAKLKVLVNDIQAHQSSVDTLNDAGRQLIESGKGTDEASTTQDKLSTLNRKWRDLLQKAADRQLELEEALRDAQRFAAEIQDLLSWLGEVDGVIAASKPVGGLPETATEQLERFMEVYNELEENRPKVETVLAQGQEYLKKSSGSGANNLQHNLKTLKQRWDNVTARANDKKIKLEIALKEATEFHEALQSFIDWLTNAEKVLTNLKPVSRVLSTILTQIEEHKSFQKDVSAHREAMLHLDKKGTHLKYFSQKQDVILIKNLLISVQHRWERVVAKSAERTRALDHGYKEAREFHDAWSNLMNWLSDTEKGLDELAVEASGIGNDPEKIKQRLAKHREFQRALSGKQATYDSTMRAGKALKERAPKADEPHLRQMMAELKEKWNSVCSKSVDRQRKLEEALLYCGQFKDALEALLDWLKKTEKHLSEEGPVHGDLDTVNALIDQHKAFEQDLSNRASQLESVKETAKELIKKASAEDAATLRSQLNEIDSLWTRTNKLSERKNKRLMEALRDAEELHRSVHMLLEWLSDAEMKLRFAATLPDDDQETRNQLSEHDKFMRELADKEHEKNATIALAQRILEKAHPDAVSVIKHWITIIQSRWDEVSTWGKQRNQKLSDHLRSLQDLDSLLEELLAWLQGLENKLLALEAEPLPEEIPVVERLIEEHKEFMETTSQRQHDVDTVCKAKQVPLAPERKQAPAKKVTPSFKSSRDNLLQEKQSKTSQATDNLPHFGPRFPPKGSKAAEPTFRNPRCKQLYDKWRNVWLLAWERQRRLQDRLNYLKELEKVRNFSWDDWRKRFLKFMNHKKSRLTDLFRKMDKNNDGLIPRDDFIDGIMKTKFDTSKLEMNAVADMFDHDGAGLIDWKEFIAALRPDWEEKRPSEAEKIHDEVKRLVMLCTCRQKFRVFQVGEGKYRFGDSQKLRLVRILRSTVMVRVGGGWVALDEFLVKNDPCRVEMLPLPNPYIPEEHEPWCPYSCLQLYSKGRTNIELREQFILADGVSQSMSAFKPKHSTASEKQKSVSLTSNTGPITKIRERTTRSVPLGKTVNRNIGTPDSLSDNESSPYARTPVRKAATPTFRGGSLPGSRGNSRPASRQGSKPPSRHGSNLSLDSTDDGTPSRIPRRSTSSSKPASLSSRKSTVNGSLSSTRSPSGLASPSTDSRSGSSLIHRASSIPTLSGSSSSGSRIPVYVGPGSADTSQQISVSSSSSGRTSSLPTPSSSHIPQPIRARTPSGTTTPVTTPGTRLQRKSSGASDVSRRNSKTPTPTELRAPFRL